MKDIVVPKPPAAMAKDLVNKMEAAEDMMRKAASLQVDVRSKLESRLIDHFCARRAKVRRLLQPNALRAKPNFLNQIKLMLPVQSPLAKINPFSAIPNHFYIPAVPTH
jgi:hypothetical protein